MKLFTTSLLLISVFILSGCGVANIKTGDIERPDISNIAPRADGGPNISLSYSTSEVHINVGKALSIGKHYNDALAGSGYFSNVNKEKSVSLQGIHIDLKARNDHQTSGFFGVTNFILSFSSAFIIPQHFYGQLNTTISIYQNGKLLKTLELDPKYSATESMWPTALPFGRSGPSTGRSYAALLATQTIDALNELNLI